MIFESNDKAMFSPLKALLHIDQQNRAFDQNQKEQADRARQAIDAQNRATHNQAWDEVSGTRNYEAVRAQRDIENARAEQKMKLDENRDLRAEKLMEAQLASYGRTGGGQANPGLGELNAAFQLHKLTQQTNTPQQATPRQAAPGLPAAQAAHDPWASLPPAPIIPKDPLPPWAHPLSRLFVEGAK